MTKGLAFLFCMLIEGAVAALLAILLRKEIDLPRFNAAVRCGSAALIGTGATNPAIWAWFSRLEGWTGTWWGAAAVSAGVILVEALFYTAALRGQIGETSYWRRATMSERACHVAGSP